MMKYAERYCRDRYGRGVWPEVRAMVYEMLEDSDSGFGMITSEATVESFVDDACDELDIEGDWRW